MWDCNHFVQNASMRKTSCLRATDNSGTLSRKRRDVSVAYSQKGKNCVGVAHLFQRWNGDSRGHRDTPSSILMFSITVRRRIPVRLCRWFANCRHCSTQSVAWMCHKFGNPKPRNSFGEYTRTSGYVIGSLLALRAAIFSCRVICLHSCHVSLDVYN